MNTSVGDERHLKDLLWQLIVLEYDALEAYKAACARIDSTETRLQMGMFHADHERHVEELDRQMRSLSEIPPTGPDMRQYLAVAKVAFGGLLGDQSILSAVRERDDEIRAAYERASARDDVPEHLRVIFAQYLGEQRARDAWLASTLDPAQPSAG